MLAQGNPKGPPEVSWVPFSVLTLPENVLGRTFPKTTRQNTLVTFTAKNQPAGDPWMHVGVHWKRLKIRAIVTTLFCLHWKSIAKNVMPVCVSTTLHYHGHPTWTPWEQWDLVEILEGCGATWLRCI
jgi:hypothetical protein